MSQSHTRPHPDSYTSGSPTGPKQPPTSPPDDGVNNPIAPHPVDHNDAHANKHVPQEEAPERNGNQSRYYRLYKKLSEVTILLLDNDIDHTWLSPSEIELFKNADNDQRRRLIEVWRIWPPSGPPLSFYELMMSHDNLKPTQQVKKPIEGGRDCVMMPAMSHPFRPQDLLEEPLRNKSFSPRPGTRRSRYRDFKPVHIQRQGNTWKVICQIFNKRTFRYNNKPKNVLRNWLRSLARRAPGPFAGIPYLLVFISCAQAYPVTGLDTSNDSAKELLRGILPTLVKWILPGAVLLIGGGFVAFMYNSLKVVGLACASLILDGSFAAVWSDETMDRPLFIILGSLCVITHALFCTYLMDARSQEPDYFLRTGIVTLLVQIVVGYIPDAVREWRDVTGLGYWTAIFPIHLMVIFAWEITHGTPHKDATTPQSPRSSEDSPVTSTGTAAPNSPAGNQNHPHTAMAPGVGNLEGNPYGPSMAEPGSSSDIEQRRHNSGTPRPGPRGQAQAGDNFTSVPTHGVPTSV